MTPSSEVTQLIKEYDGYIRERLQELGANILFARILNSNLAEYSLTLTFLHFLLQTLPVASEERPIIYCELARTYRYQGRNERAIEFFRAALLLQRRRLPQWKFTYGITLAGLGNVYLEMNDSERALCMLEKASVCFDDYPLEYKYEKLFHIHRLSYAYYLQKQYVRAMSLLRTALNECKQKMPMDHPTHAQTWHTMGLIQVALGDRDQALTAFQEALRMRKARLAPEHPHIAVTYYQMGLLYEELGEIQLAIEHGKTALLIRQVKLTPKHDELKESIQLVERLLLNKI
jgi:tetratricopeptide (TPR) repeat protein